MDRFKRQILKQWVVKLINSKKKQRFRTAVCGMTLLHFIKLDEIFE
jgi:hypothetical protein